MTSSMKCIKIALNTGSISCYRPVFINTLIMNISVKNRKTSEVKNDKQTVIFADAINSAK